MHEDMGMRKLETSILDRSIFDEKTDILALAKENGFMVANADMDDADGFIAVDEARVIPKFGSHKVIGVNARKSAKQKKAFIAQELSRYYAQKQRNPDTNLKFVQRDTLVLSEDTLPKIDKTLPKTTEKVKGKRADGKAVTPMGGDVNVVLEVDADADAETAKQQIISQLFCILSGNDSEPEDGDLSQNRFLSQTDVEEIVNDSEFYSNPFQTNIQRERDIQVTRLLKTYVDLYREREKGRIKNRNHLMWFCMIITVILIGACITLLVMWLPTASSQYQPAAAPTTTVGEPTASPAATEVLNKDAPANDSGNGGLLVSVASAEGVVADEPEVTDEPAITDEPVSVTAVPDVGTQVKTALDEYFKGEEFVSDIDIGFAAVLKTVFDSNASTGAKDIVAMLSICIIILGSVFLLLRMLFKYVLPTSEEKSMQDFVKSIQKYDFKQQIVLLLHKNKQNDHILKYLRIQEVEEEHDEQELKKKFVQEEQTLLDKMKKLINPEKQEP